MRPLFYIVFLTLFWSVIITKSQTNKVEENALLAKFETPDHRIQDVAFSPDGKLIAAGYGFYDDGGITIWDIAGRKVVAVLLEKETKKGGVKRIAFSGDGKLFAAGDDKGDVRLWKVGNWRTFKKILVTGSETTDLIFSPDSSKLAFSSEETALIYDIYSNKKEVIDVGSKNGAEFDGISFTPDGKSVVISGSNGTQIWDVENKKILKNWNNPSFNFFGRLSPDGSYFISGGGGVFADKLVEIRDFPEGRKIKELTEFRNGVFALSISNSGKFFALAGGTYGGTDSGSVSLWSRDEIKELGFARFGETPIQGLAFNPDDSILAVGSFDGVVLLYNVNRFRGRQIKKQDEALCGEIQIKDNKTYIVPLSKVPGVMTVDFVYPWRLEIANADSVQEAVGLPVALQNWLIESSSADDRVKVDKFKLLLPKDQPKSDYIVFGTVQNPGWNEGYVAKIFGDGSFAASNNSGKCLSYGNLSRLKTDYQSIRKRLLDQNLLLIPKEPLTIGADHYRTQFIELSTENASEIRSDADSFEILINGQSKKREAFSKIYRQEEPLLKSLLNAGFK
jgi:WD40 repeat protein